MDKRIRSKLAKMYYSPRGYWKGQGAIKKLTIEAKVSESKAREWLTKQAIWQIYLPYPKYIPTPTSANALQQKPNHVHQVDLLFLPHDTIGKKVRVNNLRRSEQV